MVENENQRNLTFSKQKEDNAGNKSVNELKDERSPFGLSRSDTSKKSWMLSMMYKSKSQDESFEEDAERSSKAISHENSYGNLVSKSSSNCEIRGGNVRDLQEKLSKNGSEIAQKSVNGDGGLSGDLNGIIERAREGLSRVGSQSDIKSPPIVNGQSIPSSLEKKFEKSDQQWEQLINNLNRPLLIHDLDFTDLIEDDDIGISTQANALTSTNAKIPPPPPPPPPPSFMNKFPPAPPPLPANPGHNLNFNGMKPPSLFPLSNSNMYYSNNKHNNLQDISSEAGKPIQKNKKTIKLFWKEVNDDPILLSNLKSTKSIWDELKPVVVDEQKLEHLFESRARDFLVKVTLMFLYYDSIVICIQHLLIY